MDSSLRPRVLTPQPPEVHEPKGKWWVMKFISEAVSKVGKGGRPALLSFDEMPEWFKRESNQWILYGYRPISGSIYTSLYSLSYIHNESVNIYTHLIPAALFLVGECYIQQYLNSRSLGSLPPIILLSPSSR